MNKLREYKYWLLYAAVFTLPMYMRLNNIVLGIFVITAILDSMFFLRTFNIKDILSKAWPVLVFFGLSVMASFYEFELASFKLLEKYWSFLLIPMVIIPDRVSFSKRRNQIFLSLLWGCVATLLICYGNVIWEMITKGEPIDYFFRWRHVGHQFTEIADTHPTYLGIFVVTSILYLIQTKIIGPSLKILLFFFLILGLFQLASRMALLLFVIFFLFLITTKVKELRWQITALVLGILACSAIFLTFGSRYMEDRIFSKESVLDDKRVERWKVSYEIFKEHPYFGVGYAEIKALRKAKYIENDFPLAAASEYNAHNQFLEYLSTNGALGGFVYTIALFYLLLVSVKRKDPLYTYIFFFFILANFTESTMVRIKGIEYFAVFATIFLCHPTDHKEPDEYIYNT